MRGGRRTSTRAAARTRFTPACAGRTRFLCECFVGESVHPRVCGEDLYYLDTRMLSGGSPPRVRGGQHRERVRGRACRFTPACAGRTWCGPFSMCPDPVRPRVCGEDASRHRLKLPTVGSPPRVRGGRWDLYQEHGRAPVHPRVCGEDRRSARINTAPIGSPPRVRGGPKQACVGCREVRFTPACAGRTDAWNGLDFKLPVHPRVCGEDSQT